MSVVIPIEVFNSKEQVNVMLKIKKRAFYQNLVNYGKLFLILLIISSVLGLALNTGNLWFGIILGFLIVMSIVILVNCYTKCACINFFYTKI